MKAWGIGVAILAGLLVSCSRTPAPAAPALLVSHVANRTPSPEVELGLRLFFDPKLSADGSISCATCHQPGRGFSNGAAVGTGIGGKKGNRSVPTIYAAGHDGPQFWDGRAATLEAQALMPIANPDEMGAKLPEVVAKLNKDPLYTQLFQAVYGGPATAQRLGKAIATFERALKANQSPFDRFQAGDQSAMNDSQKRGWEVFQDRGRCIECHKGSDLSDTNFHNIGVGTDTDTVDVGRMAVTKLQSDWASFKTPTLRNIAKTAPYMHDGSQATLNDVVKFYNRGGLFNPNIDPKMKPIHLGADEQEDLLAFLGALTSPDNLKDLAPSPSGRPTSPPRR